MLERINREGRVTAVRLAAELHVSEDTIRRDLGELADASSSAFMAAPIAARQWPPDSSTASGDRGLEKAALAARGLLQPKAGMVVLLDQGTTLLAPARQLAQGTDVTIIIPAPDIALAVVSCHDPGVELDLVGTS